MKISISWLKKYIELTEDPEKIAERLTMSGLEVEGVDEFEEVKGGLKGLVIGEVITAEKHPNADRLKVTTVDVGAEEVLPIVCGAPNVAAGQKVVVATVGTTIFPLKGEPFTINKAKIRGEVSQGMICAEDEIGLGTSHDGILVLNTDLQNGTPAVDYFGIHTDTVLEIGLTPNRADAASHIGVARDLKALLKKEIQYPAVENFQVDNHDLPIKVTVENTKACPRYSGITITDVKVEESPAWLKARLKSIGLSPINSVVDITNFVLHELGQPMHAFDADAIAGNHVVVKTLPEGSVFTTLDGKERKLLATDLMICNEEEGMCIAGVFGGAKSGVKKTTKNVFLESAYFSPDYVRSTAQHHTLKTDASFRYERGTDPNITVYALKRAALLIQEIAGGKISSDIVDIYPEPIQNFTVKLSYKNIDRLIGKKLAKEQIKEILTLLDIKIMEEGDESFTVSVPPYRVDVQREADVIEEILRIYGYNNIEIPEHLNSDFLANFPKIDPGSVQQSVSEMLAANGYREIITNSLTKPAYNQAISAELKPVEILNKLSEDLAEMRQSLLFTGLEVVAHNVNRKKANLKLFEFGSVYSKAEDKYLQEKQLAIFMTGNFTAESWMENSQPNTFYNLSSTITKIFNRFGIDAIDSVNIKSEIFKYGLQCSIDDQLIATFGEVNSKIAALADVRQPVFFASIKWQQLLDRLQVNHSAKKHVYQEISRFPEVRRDLSLVLDKHVSFSQIEKLARENSNHLLKDINVFDVYEGDNIEKGKKAYALSFTLQDQEKTLTDKTIDKVMDKLMGVFEEKVGAIIRK